MDRKILLATFASVAVMLAACTCPCGVDSGSSTSGSAEDFNANVPHTVYFDFDKAALSQAAKQRVVSQADWLKTYTATKVTVAGNTDSRGTSEYNMALGQKRADATAKELVDNGVGSDRVTTVSYGKERLVDTGTTEAAHAKNRRTETSLNQ
ncbi:MAG: OmpA family protein [Holosporales bacterium]|nr:OmpA family protein [Holosporales bacterium]